MTQRRLAGKKLVIPSVIVLALVILGTIMLFFANRKVWRAKPHEPIGQLAVDRRHAAEALAAYVRIDTSTPPGIPRDAELPHIRLLVDRYVRPLGLEHEILDDRILLVRWPAEGGAETGPVVYLSHADVVPVSADERSRWTHPPFDGRIADGFVWGRGTIDNKASTICQLEAIRAMKEQGLSPHRDVLLLVVPDEEIGGEDGAGRVVERHLGELGDPWAVIDEGSFVLPDFVEGQEIAAIAVGEKRYVTIRLEVEGKAGHSSMPRLDDPPDVLASALGALAGYQQPVRIVPPVSMLLDRMGSAMPLHKRLVVRNRWLFGRAVEKQLAAKPSSNAIVRDTMALTKLRAGVKDNVVPGRASATYNMRLLPGSDLDRVLGRIRSLIGDDRVEIEVVQDWGDTPVAPYGGDRFFRLARALRTAMPEVLVTPTITPASMDARYFAQKGIPSYRIVPFTLDGGERQRIHGIDERLSLRNVEQGARVYAHMMRYF